MPKPHTVSPGDCIASLTQSNGFGDYKIVYDAAANAGLKTTRPNPNVLASGDVVVIPDPVPKKVDLRTGKAHKLTLAVVETLLRTRVVDSQGNGLGGLSYELRVGADKFTGTTPADGMIEHSISATETSGTLQLWKKKEPGIDGYRFQLEIGSLEHESVDHACQARLLNLGFDCGGVGGAMDDKTKGAVRGFQKKTGLTVNATFDANTRTKLRIEHEGA